MAGKLGIEDGKRLVKAARLIIEDNLSGTDRNKDLIERLLGGFGEKRGVFVTLNRYSSHELRGCIGLPTPVMPLKDAVRSASISAATDDPRFPPVKSEEMDEIIIEVSVLTPPEKIVVSSPKEYRNKIKIGRDGLIIKNGPYSGLLLPQVPVEWKWDIDEYLAHICMKAGLTPDMWLDEQTELYSFQAQVFKEKTPGGEIIEEKFEQYC